MAAELKNRGVWTLATDRDTMRFVTHKDIDDPNVNEEMRDKLAAAGLKSGSIPVFDVGGKILVGFSEDSLDTAWAAVNKGAKN